MNKKDLTVLVLSILGSLKLILEAFGISGIADADLNAIANGVAGLFAVVGVIRGAKGKKKEEVEKE